MKKVVFLFFMLCCLNSTDSHAANAEIYRFDNYQLRLTYTSDEDHNRGYEIEKIGTNPFSMMLMFDDIDILIANVIEVEGNHVFYGSLIYHDNPRSYKGLMIVLSPSGEELQRVVIDFGMQQEVIHVFPVEDVILVVTRCDSTDERYSLYFDHYTVESYSYNYELLHQLELNQEFNEFSATDHMILLNIEHDSIYEYMITSELELIDAQEPLPIETNTVFTGSVFIPFLNTALLNQNIVEHGVYLEYPGKYQLQYQGFIYNFTVEPLITGIEEDMIYKHSVSPHISAGNVFLNNDLFVSGTTIAKPGNYELKVIGINGYRETTTFTITSNMTGIVHNQTYVQPVEIIFNGNGYLNNNYVTSPYEVRDPGEYIFKIVGENDYLETYYFTIQEPVENHSFVDFIQQYDIALLGVTLVGGLLFLKKK